MSLLGKILAIINAVAALGFIYLALSDYGKRQQWSYAVFRHDLAIDGLPLDESQLDLDSKPIAKNLNKPTLDEMFQQAGGQPVKTQLEELNRRKSEVISKIDGGPMTVPNLLDANPPTITLDTPAQRAAWFLLPFAKSILERDPLLTQIFNPKQQNVNAAAIEQLFTDVLARGSAGDKRQGIAEVLLGLLEPGEGDPFESQAFKRYVTVVGRKAAATAIDNQAAALTQLARETNDVLAAGRATFAATHGQAVLRNLDIVAALQKEKETLELQRNQTARQKELVAERQAQVDKLVARLEAARKTTRAYLDAQEKLQKALLDGDRQLRDANSTNQGLEQKLQKLEQQ
jgi:hypothetical protein